jgi:hypothetical protein
MGQVVIPLSTLNSSSTPIEENFKLESRPGKSDKVSGTVRCKFLMKTHDSQPAVGKPDARPPSSASSTPSRPPGPPGPPGPPRPPGMPGGDAKEKFYVGGATMFEDGTIQLHMNIGGTLLTYPPTHEKYDYIKSHLSTELGRPMVPGDGCACPGF